MTDPGARRPTCSVAIHSFNRRDLLDRALDTLLAGIDPSDVEVIVSDSGSTDGSCELVRRRYPSVRLVELETDRGLAAGRNAGMQLAQGIYTLMMDEDVVITPEHIKRFVGLMEAHPQAGILAFRKVDERGEALYQYHVPAPSTMNLLFFIMLEWSVVEGLRSLKRRFRIGEAVPGSREEIVEIPYHGGALLFVRTEAARQVGPWDENIFFYGEDFDWCYRFRRCGWKILYFPQITVQAFHGTNSRRTRRTSLIAMKSRRYLFLKYLGAGYLPLYYIIALLGLIPKSGYYLIQSVRGRDARDLPFQRWLWYAVRTIFGRPPTVALKG